ncbi:MMPL family transporter, partial [bacterium]|nr:MMPL family transporter [bacterium]
MKQFFLWSQAHPYLVIPILLTFTIVSLFYVGRLRLETSSDIMMVEGAPEKTYYNETLERFGTDQISVIFVKDPHLFTPPKIAILEQLHYDLEGIDGVTKVESLFTVSNFKDDGGMLNTNPLIDWIPETKEEAEAIKKNALANPILVNNLVSKNGDAIAFNLSLDPWVEDPNFMITLHDETESILDQYKPHFNTLFQMGNPFNIKSQNRTLEHDMNTLMPITAILLLGILMFMMGSVSAAILPILTSAVSILATLGFMGFMDLPITILTFTIPSLLLVIGSTEDIHILSEYIHGVKQTGSRSQAIKYMA